MTQLVQGLKKTAIAAAILSFSAVASATIVTSIKPLGFIASAIANGVTDVDVLVPTGASPHDYNLKPSDAQKLKSAEMVVWIGEDVDLFLDKSIDDLDYKKVLTIKDIAAIEPFLMKGEHHHHHGEGDAHEHDHEGHHHAHEGHDHKHEHGDHDHKHEHAHAEHDHKHDHAHEGHEHHHDDDASINWHVWYSPDISKVVAQRIAAKLVKQYPEKKALIEKNVAEFDRTLAETSVKIKAQLESVKDKGFYVVFIKIPIQFIVCFLINFPHSISNTSNPVILYLHSLQDMSFIYYPVGFHIKPYCIIHKINTFMSPKQKQETTYYISKCLQGLF